MPKTAPLTYSPITTGGPWYMVNTKTKELMCSTNRLRPPFWSRQWNGACLYIVKQSAWAAANRYRKVLGHFDYDLLNQDEVKDLWRKLDAAVAAAHPAPTKEPEVLTVPEQEEEPSALASTPGFVPEEEETKTIAAIDPAQNELLMAAMATEHALLAEEATAYEMWQHARVKLRNHKKQREFLEQSCKCARKP